nr:hypothetical protein [Tanacetum cinerariifolium]
MQGFNDLHPMGCDAFRFPSDQYTVEGSEFLTRHIKFWNAARAALGQAMAFFFGSDKSALRATKIHFIPLCINNSTKNAKSIEILKILLLNNQVILPTFSFRSEFDLNEQNNDSGSELDDDDYNVYDYASSAESDTASIDHLSEGEEKFLEVRTTKVGLKPKEKATMMFGEKFLTMIFNGLPRDDFDDCNDPKTDDQDMIGDHWPNHDPNIK